MHHVGSHLNAPQALGQCVNSFLSLQIENAAEEPRVLCIIQDTTNSKTVNERLTVNLPASTSLSKLHEDVAHKAGYVIGTFDLTWGNTSEMVGPYKPECS